MPELSYAPLAIRSSTLIAYTCFICSFLIDVLLLYNDVFVQCSLV